MSNDNVYIYVDGACKGNHKVDGERVGMCCVYIPIYEHRLIITSPTIKTNNQAEWQAVLWGICASRYYIGKKCVIYTDSQLVSRQLSGEYKVNDSSLSCYCNRARNILRDMDNVSVEWISRSINLAGIILEDM